MTRRQFLLASAFVPCAPRITSASQRQAHRRTMSVSEFRRLRRFRDSPFGRLAYIDPGRGPGAIFLHGLPLNGFFWRDAVSGLQASRRCLGPDLVGLGYTDVSATQKLSPAAQAEMIEWLLDALSIDAVDVVANDSGGAIAQLSRGASSRARPIVAADQLRRAHGSAASDPRTGRRGRAAGDVRRRIRAASRRQAVGGSVEGIGGICYADPATLTDEASEYYFSPLLRTSARRAQFNRYISSFLPNPLPAIEPRLAAYRGPVRVLWGEDDRVFDKSWAAWLDRTFPGSRGIRWVSGGKLFFPEEFPDVVTEEARRLWNAR
jgi:haloalkane dehalogenase